MSNSTITTAFIDKFNADFGLEFQQKGSRLRPHVMIDPLAAEFGYFEYINSVSAYEKTGRSQEVTEVTPDHVRRRCSMKDYLVPVYVDKFDQKRTQIDVVSGYVQTCAHALGRKLDERILEAALGTAYQGRSGATAVVLPAAQKIAVDFQEGGGGSASGLTTGKIREALQILEADEALSPDGDDSATLVYTSHQKQNLLKVLEDLKVDSATTTAIATGNDSGSWHGIKFVRLSTGIVPTDSSDYRKVVVYVKPSIAVCENANPSVEINYIPNKTSTLINAMGSFDASRVRDNGVVQILCSEA